MTNELLALFLKTWHGRIWTEFAGANKALPESLRMVAVPMEDQIKGLAFEGVNAGKPLLDLWVLLREMEVEIQYLLPRPR